MKISQIKFDYYRNLKNGHICPGDGVNIFFGDNAQGKTNLLECIWLFTGGKSFRGSKDREVINFDSDCSKIEIDFFSKNREQNAKIILSKNKRFISLNGVEKKTASSFVGNFCSVVFSPVHMSIVKNGPGLRRKFLDSAICQLNPMYAVTLIKYNHVLNQRNTLIKDIKYHSELMDTLEIWDIKLAKYAKVIIKNRLNYVEKLKKIAKKIYLGISDGKEEFEVSYNMCYDSREREYVKESTLLSEYRKKLDKDLKFGFTSVGPHRDDIDIYVDGKLAKDYASQGQQRSCVLAMKLAESEILTDSIGEKPVILLDDVMSELDNKRQDYILNSIKDFQVFITCCEPSTVLRLVDGKKFKIEEGKLY